MITRPEYALLSANVYGNSDLVRTQRNTLPVPEGWTGLDATSGYLINDTATGFMARVYMRGNEVVISYCGTTFEPGDQHLDWINGNVPAGIGNNAKQVLQAAKLYLDVARDPQFAGKSISLTGHSLGGGLASLVSVWFDRPATVFDQAPFLKSADSARVYDWLRSELQRSGYTIPAALDAYQVDRSVLSATLNQWDPSPTRLARQAQVNHTFIKDEILSLLSSEQLDNVGATVGGTLALFSLIAPGLGRVAYSAYRAGNGLGKISNGADVPIDLNVQKGNGWGWKFNGGYAYINPVDLHSMHLLTACLLSSQFESTMRAHPELLQRLFGGVYPNTPDVDTANLLDLLVQRQYRGEGSLEAVATDVNKIDFEAGATGMQSDAWRMPGRDSITVGAMLVDAVLAYMYEQGKDRAPDQMGGEAFSTLFRQVTGGLTIDAALLGEQAALVERQLLRVIEDIAKQDGVAYISEEAGLRWTIQTGNVGMNADMSSDARDDRILGHVHADTMIGGGGSDVLIGMDGTDLLIGNAGLDTLVGGQGNDTIEGGAGSDSVYGGAGLDTYRFGGHWNTDIIRDSGHDGAIVVEGLGTLNGSGAKRLPGDSNIWQTDDKRVTYIHVAAESGNKGYLLIGVDGDANGNHRGNIRIDDWSDGRLGITLGSEVAAAPVSNEYWGDFAKQDNGTQYAFIDNGGYSDFRRYANGGAQAGAQDVLNGRTDGSADHLYGLDGNDGLAGGSGDDTIEGGAGDDLIKGGTGADSLIGGAGNDVILGSALGDVATPFNVGAERDPVPAGWEAFTQGFSWTTLRQPGPRIDSNGVLSFKVSGVRGAFTGPAWLVGEQWYIETSGNVIDGGAGDDYIAAGTAADVVHGGADDDDIFGQEDADVLFGDAGADAIVGDGFDSTDPEAFNAGGLWYLPGSEGHGADVIDGGAGDDWLWGTGSDDEIYGGATTTGCGATACSAKAPAIWAGWPPSGTATTTSTAAAAPTSWSATVETTSCSVASATIRSGATTTARRPTYRRTTTAKTTRRRGR